MLQLSHDRIASPIGTILAVWQDEDCLRALDFSDYEQRMHKLLQRYVGSFDLRSARAPSLIKRSVDRYFAGEFDALCPMRVETGGTAFQQRVWRALINIPPSKTMSYGVLASKIGNPNAVRAVGAANGANPIAIVIPCHRVVGSNGHLTGYGGGLWRKKWLLEHEAKRFGAHVE